MARPAPSVERTVKLLKFLAEHPRERFSLSDIARRLEFNKATCHAMLSELVDEGMLIRHPAEKTYMLGPALVNLGTAAAMDATEALEVARPEMIAIHEDLKVSCVASSLIGHEIVVMARKDVERPLFGYLPVGNRSPLVAPFGAEFMAWAPESSVEEWLDLHQPALSPEERSTYYSFLDTIRLTGYHATSFEQLMALRRIVELLGDLPGAKELRVALQLEADEMCFEAEDPGDYAPVVAIRAPVFGPSSSVVLVLSIGQFGPDVTIRDMPRFAARLLEGTRRVTAALHGSEPFPQWARTLDRGGRLPSEPGPAAVRRRMTSQGSAEQRTPGPKGSKTSRTAAASA